MYTILLETHSILRYVILLFVMVVIVKNMIGWINRSEFLKFDNILSSVTVSTIHLQLLLGLVLYFVSPLVSFQEGVMKNDAMRYYTVEHLLLMAIAIALFTIGRVKIKKKDNPVIKHRTGFIYNLSGLLIIVITLALGSRGII